MDCDRLIELLSRGNGWLSGEEIGDTLGITGKALDEKIRMLQAMGWGVDADPHRGYRLEGVPPELSGGYISGKLPEGSLFAGKVEVRERVDSTNTRLKAMAAQGAPEGAVLLAETQDGGRGTHGRAFLSPRGGVYLSLLLRPRVPLTELFSLTGWAAVAVRRGIRAACGAEAEIKWLNDLYLGGGKLVGILTELSLREGSCEPDYVVIGVGVNVEQSAEELRAAGLDGIAASLATAGYSVERNALTAALLREFEEMYRDFPQKKSEYLEEYRAHCLTLGRRVSFEVDGRTVFGRADRIGEDFSLVVAGDDGGVYSVSSGTVRLL